MEIMINVQFKIRKKEKRMAESKNYNYFNSIDEFIFIDDSNIGKGSFGKVKLAFHLRTNRIYAIKIINLKNITSEVGMKALQMEINFHPTLQHPHIIKLWDVIEEKQMVYLILEYAQNGNLFSYQNKRQIFSESEAFVYFSQALSAIKYMHSIDLMHRDLKPENLLLDKDFNIKICDFGWVTDDIIQRKKTFCGTYEYMAPQMIQTQDYDYRVDIWALGILLYELLHGFAPFEGENVEEVKRSMENGVVKLGSHLSSEVGDLIEKILQVKPESRIKISEIENHSWIHKQIIKNSLLMLKSIKSVEKRTTSKENEPETQSGIETNRKIVPEKNKFFLPTKNTHKHKQEPFTSTNNKLDKNLKSKKKVQAGNESIKLPRKMIKVGSIGIKEKKVSNLCLGEKSKESGKGKMNRGHKVQKSELSEFKNSYRMATEGAENKKLLMKKKQAVRFNTEMSEVGQNFFETKSNLKKKGFARKKTANLESGLGRNGGIKFLRKSLEYC